MDAIFDQLRGEIIRLVVIGVVGGVSTAGAIIGWLIRRDLRRSDAENAEYKKQCDKDAAARGLEFAAHVERFNDHVRRAGLETKDIQYRIGIMATQIKQRIPEVTVPEWPSR